MEPLIHSRPGHHLDDADWIFVGCLPCQWVEARLDLTPRCPSGRHQAQEMKALLRCAVCRWQGWYKHRITCPQMPAHAIEILEFGPRY